MQISVPYTLDQGWGTYVPPRAARNVHYRWRTAKSIEFVLQLCFYLTMRGRVTSLDFRSKYLFIIELRFDAMLCSNWSNANSGAGHIKRPRGPQVPHPCFRLLKLCA